MTWKWIIKLPAAEKEITETRRSKIKYTGFTYSSRELKNQGKGYQVT